MYCQDLEVKGSTLGPFELGCLVLVSNTYLNKNTSVLNGELFTLMNLTSEYLIEITVQPMWRSLLCFQSQK